jgi:hypothetical protein
MGWVQKLKTKWGIQSNFDFIMIMLAFSLAGSMISVCRPPIFHLLGITKETHLWIKILVYVPLIPPIYQVFLLFWGTILGQFEFFWEKEKKIGRFLKQSFLKATASLRRS